MDADWQKVRKRYYVALTEVLRQFDRSIFDESEMAHVLERLTEPRLRSSSHWFISGISGSGKTTVTRILQEQGFHGLPNVTTRAKRSNEQETDYVFTDEETFAKWEQNGLLFHSHTTNGVSHAIRYEDLQRLSTNEKLYADKSVTSLSVLYKEVPALHVATLIYLLPPSFDELCIRIEAREKSDVRALSRQEILTRFSEEIEEMHKSIELPYAYIVNDSKERVTNKVKSFTA